MPTVTGTLTDFAAQPLASYSPRIVFTASGVATSVTGGLFATRPVVVVPGSSGDFSVTLQSTAGLNPLVWYQIRIEWIDSAGSFTAVDLTDWKLFVPTSGGSIGELIGIPPNPALAWIDVEPPEVETSGGWWLQVNPDDPNDPRNTGILYESV